MNTLKNLTNKEMVDKIRVYADIADVSYAFFEYIDENEIWGISDKFYNNVILKQPNPRWDYADGTNLGYEKTINENGISKLAPTSYALCVEARFMQDLTIKKPKSDEKEEDEFVKIDNEIKNFIYVDKKTKEQRIFINEEGYHQISERTKKFTSRFILLKHQKNDDEGFSATLFEDTKDNNKKNTSIRVLGYDIDMGSLDVKLKRANNDEKKESQMQNKEALDHQSLPLGAVATNFTAHPVIEDDIITCPHGGRVVLKSKAGRSIKSQDIPLILGRGSIFYKEIYLAA